MLKLAGKLSISRVTSNKEPNFVEITVVDAEASVEAISVKVSIETFANALFGSGYQDCEFEFNDSGRVGTIHEHKEELVPIPDYGNRPEGWQKKALAPFEVDGWSARSGDITNGHLHVTQKGQNHQRVAFFRNMPKVQP
jgi:hypothetical protein